jgi:hypothetical protein
LACMSWSVLASILCKRSRASCKARRGVASKSWCLLMTRFGAGQHLVQTVEGILQGTTRSCKQGGLVSDEELKDG